MSACKVNINIKDPDKFIYEKITDELSPQDVIHYFYIDAIQTDYNNASSYISQYQSMGMNVDMATFLGYDTAKPLDQQEHPTAGKTWAEYYWGRALNDAKTVYAMYELAVKDHFQMPEDYSASIDRSMMDFQITASFNDCDVDTVLRSIYGDDASEKKYREYLTIKTTATAYYQAHQDSKAFTDAERDAYYQAHTTDFTAYSYNSYTVNYHYYLPEKETVDGMPVTYTTREENDARKEAKKVADSLATLNSVADLDAAIAALPYNEGKDIKSTAYTNIPYSSFTGERLTWISAADRKAGDAMVFEIKITTGTGDDATKVITGYTVMMFVSKYDYSNPTGNVRHVLVQYKGGTYNPSTGLTTYGDAEKAAAYTQAQNILARWEKGDKSEASFIELVKISDDTASVADGGLYKNIGKNSAYEINFENWAIDPARKAGDYEIISTAHGYHIMFYSGAGEGTVRDTMINPKLLREYMTNWEMQVVDSYPLTIEKTDSVPFDVIVNDILH